MGIQPYLITSAAKAFIAPRLVRLLCTKCREKVSTTTASVLPGSSLTFYFQRKGCEACRFTGYNGRTAIYEILIVDDRIRELILQKAPSGVIKKEAVRLGMKTLYQNGLRKVAAGLTTSEELLMTTEPSG
jgi:general secretion pathway protein E